MGAAAAARLAAAVNLISAVAEAAVATSVVAVVAAAAEALVQAVSLATDPVGAADLERSSGAFG